MPDTPTTETAGSSPVASAPSAPSAPASPVASNPPAAKPSVVDVLKAIPKDQRKEFLFGRKPLKDVVPLNPAPAEAAPAASTPDATPTAASEAPPAPAEVAPPGSQPAAETTQPAASPPEGSDPEPTGDDAVPSRFRFASAEDKAIALIAKSRGVSLYEAAIIYKGAPAPQATPATTTPAQPSAPSTAPATNPTPADPGVAQYDQRISETESKVQELIAQRVKHREAAEFEKVDEISDQIAELKATATILKNEKQGYLHHVENQRHASYAQSVDVSAQRVYADYPQFAKEDGMERLALDAFVIRAQQDPARAALFQSTTWPEVLAAEFAAKNGIKPKSAQPPVASAPAAPAAPQPAPAPTATLQKPQPRQVTPATGARLLTSSDGKHPSQTGAMTREQIEARIKNDPDFRRGLVRSLRPAGT